MTNALRRLASGWLVWCALFIVAVRILLLVRGEIDQSHAVLTMLLVVLGGSVAGGRALGFTLAGVGAAVIDYFFQPPYDLLSVNKPLDVVVLFAYLSAAFVTTELLVRARREADDARSRAREVENLSRLGAATLRLAEPEAALSAIASLVGEMLGASACAIHAWDATAGLTSLAPAAGDWPSASDARLAAAPTGSRVVAERAALLGVAVISGRDGTAVPLSDSLPGDDAAATVESVLLGLPLSADERVIGVLLVHGAPLLSLDAPRRRFALAIAYYAALALERMRLMREIAHSQTLRETNRARDQILASVSHDLRTPLTTIKVLAQGAQSRGEPAALAIVEQADRLARMVGDLLELSRLRVGGIAASAELNTAEDVVGAALRQTQGILDGRRISTDDGVGSPVLVGVFDFVQTLRILGNLLDNALRHTPAGGVVDVHVRREGASLVFTVADRGPGVPAIEAERIFDSFYRPAGATPDAGRAGLGLSIARTLAELQGGSLRYAPRAGGGSEFELRLPAAEVNDSDTDAGEFVGGDEQPQ